MRAPRHAKMRAFAANLEPSHGLVRSRLAGPHVQQPGAGAGPSARTSRAGPRDSAAARDIAACAASTCATATGANETLDVFPAPRARCAGAGVHPWRLLALARQERPFLRRAGLHTTAAPAWWCPTTRCARHARAARDRRRTSCCRWCARSTGPGATSRPTAAIRRASRSPAIRPAGTWRRCCWPATGRPWRRTCRRSWCAMRCRSRGCTTWRRCSARPSWQTSLRLSAADARAPARRCGRRRKRGQLYTVAGGDESEEFLRQNALIREAWGRNAVPVCEVLPGLQPLQHASMRWPTRRIGCTGWRCNCCDA